MQKYALHFTRSGLSDHLWSLEEIVKMAESYMPKPGQSDPYK